MIVVEIKNADEVARQHSRFKAFLGRALGIDVQRRVEEEVAKQLKAELEKQGVKADVSVK